MLASIFKAFAMSIVLELDHSAYLASLSSVPLAVNDLHENGILFANAKNFSAETNCDVLHLNKDGSGAWKQDLNEASLGDYLGVSCQKIFPYASQAYPQRP